MIRKVYLTLAVVGSLLLIGLYASAPGTVLNSAEDYRALVPSRDSRLRETLRGNEATKIVPNEKAERTRSSATTADINGSPTKSVPADSGKPSTELYLEQPVPQEDDPSNVHEKYVIYQDKCRVKSYDHNDPEILKKYFSKEPTTCPSNAKPFVFYPVIDMTAGRYCVGVDQAIVDGSYEGKLESWDCTYKEPIRDRRQRVIDMYFYFGEKKAFKAGDCPPEEFIWIECKRPGVSRVYQQPLMLPRVKPVPNPIRPNNFGRKPFHVLVVGLDAVSRLNAYRQLPKTLEFLRTNKNLVELFGYNKIEDNSMPNQIPLLTGIPYAPPGMKARLGRNYFDNVTRYLWDDYEERGYRTMYYEEQWNYGLFVFPSTNGFSEVPTTYWPRPIMQAIDKSALKVDGNRVCIGPDLPAKHYLDYTYNTMRILGEDRPLFSYSWLCEAAHDDVNGGHRDDKYFLDFFTKMESSGILNSTAVFFISDHGSRIGDFRKSALGRYEDMLPFGFVLMPDSYYEVHRNALENLQANSKRLVTVYDIHATLLELTDPWSEGRVTRTANGYSLLSNVIPSDRTCKRAGINSQFCSCFESQPQDTGSDLSQSLAKFVIDELNNVIKKNKAAAKCQEWSLDTIDDFVRLSEGNHWTNFYKATIKTEPSAQFEVAAQLQQQNKTWNLLSDIDRTDWFSTNAKCASRTSYEKYCYCRCSGLNCLWRIL